MSKTLVVLSFMLVLQIQLFSQPQQQIWYFNGKGVDFTTSPPNVFNLPTDYGSFEPEGATNGAYGFEGSLLFYLIDGTIFNKNGDVIDVLTAEYSAYINNSEVQIVQVPGDCGKYFIIYYDIGTWTSGSGPFQGVSLKYSVLDLSLNNGLGGIESNSKDILIKDIKYEAIGSTAVSKINQQGSRYLYYGYGHNSFVGSFGLYKFIISNSGITLDFKLDLSDVPGYLHNLELELSHDQSMLAFGDSGSENVFGGKYVYFIHLDENGDINTELGNDGTTKVELVENENRLITGLEFSHDNELLFISSPGYGIYYIDIANNFTSSGSIISGTNNLGNSQLELAFDGYIYAAENKRLLYPIDYQTSTPVLVTSQIIDLGSNVIVESRQNVGGSQVYSYSLPDQIDGEDYGDLLVNLTINCCLNHSFFDKDEFTTESGSGVWTSNDNPLNDGTGNIAYVKNDLIIAAGSDIEIQDMEIHFAPDAKVIIEPKDGSTPAGKLVLNNTTFTLDQRCEPDKFWKGVQVGGNRNLHQFSAGNQGVIELENGASIEFARTAISLMLSGDLNTAGGIVRAKDSYFVNNKRAVEFMSYKNFLSSPQNEMDNHSSFSNTTFIVDDNFLEGQDFNTHVTMWDVRGVKFRGCRFINDMTDALFDESHNKGIYSIDAGYFIEALCDAPGMYSPPCPQQYLIPSEFRGFSFAVQASTSSTNKAVSIDQTEFGNNYFGAVLDRLNSFRVVRSEFIVGESDLIDPFTIQPRHQKGLHSIKNTRFTIEDNLLVGAQIGNPSIGIRIDDAQKVYSRTYNNDLEHLYVGHKLVGYNRHQSGPDKGFQTICNRHHNNSEGNHEHDILVEQNNNPDKDGILQYQGSKNPEISSSTTFSHTGTNSYSDVNNLSNWHVDFFHTDGNTKPIYYNTEVEEKLVNIAHSCPSNFSGKYSEHQVMSISERNAWLDLYDDVELDYADLLYNYEQLMDGGSTSDLVDRIQSTWPQEAWDLYDDLIEQSPFLSEQVLIETADQDVLPVALYFEVCLANPDASKSSNFLHYIEFEAPSPLPGYMVEIIRENRDSITLRSLMEMAMIDKSAELSGIANLMLTEYQLDTIRDLDKILYWISRPNNLHDRYVLIESFIEEGDFANAFNFYNGIDNDFDLRDQLETAYNEVGDYIQFRELIYLDNRTIAELDSMEQLELEIMAATYIGHTQRFAANILCFFYDNCQYIPIPPNQQSHRPVHSTKQETAADFVIHQLKVYPNPAQAYTTFSWEFEELNGTADLLIFNANGQLVASRPITDRIGQWALDTRQLYSGLYLYQLKSNGNQLAAGRITIQK